MRTAFVFAALAFVCLLSATAAVSVRDIQYTTQPGMDSTFPSPLAGNTITVSGVVSAVDSEAGCYWLYDSPTPWSGITVYDRTHTPALGQKVTLTAQVEEYFGCTRLVNVSAYNVNGSGVMLNPCQVSTFELANNGEAWEGMLVRASGVNIGVNGSSFYGNDGSGPAVIDNDLLPNGLLVNGQTFGTVTGMVSFKRGQYQLQPRTRYDLELFTHTTDRTSWGKVKSLYR